MNTKRQSITAAALVWLLILAAFALAWSISAADVAGTPVPSGVVTDASSATKASPLELLITFLTPGLIALVKTFFPRVPRPLLPWLAPVFGALLEIIGTAAGMPGTSVVAGALLGAAGVGVREAYDQAKKGLAAAGQSHR